MGVSQIRGTFIGLPNSKDCCSRVYIGVPLFGETAPCGSILEGLFQIEMDLLQGPF